ncbi:fatty acid desaturase [Colletotrichum higginsianum]|nr:fatty acid desaturase [Colletotrichum higginsianum]
MSSLTVRPDLTVHDTIVLQNLIDDIKRYDDKHLAPADGDEGYVSQESLDEKSNKDDERLNDPVSQDFEPSVLSSVDLRDLPARIPAALHRHVVLPYVAWARRVVRHETDVLMLTHLLLYFTTSVPSALLLFRSFGYLHGVLHMALQFHYMGTYTLMMHQHIHMGGILSRDSGRLLKAFDAAFPYITDPLMGHTWNTYFYHHVKHHHVEGNGPNDLSTTIRYQRDDALDFLRYVARFFFLVWFDLPRYFLGKGQLRNAWKTGFWELGNYAVLYALYRLNSRATTFVFLGPLLLLRLGLMVGNWGQHAFVDTDEPDSDFRSSITLIDVPSNRYCYNDGYHTSHHLNPRRHWRDHPTSFLQQKKTYIREKALVFHDIDYLMVTVRLLRKDYMHLARRLVPVGEQIGMTIEERAAMLQRHTRRFSEAEIRDKFRGYKTK